MGIKLDKDEQKKRDLIEKRMKALAKLEDELDCVFMPVTHHSTMGGYVIGTSNYIVPIDKQEEKKKKKS